VYLHIYLSLTNTLESYELTTSLYYMLHFHFNIISPSGLFLSSFPTRAMNAFLFSHSPDSTVRLHYLLFNAYVYF